jgi:chromate transport protein ChrA
MTDITTTEVADAPSPMRYTLWQLVRYMLALGTWGFGGPVALAGAAVALFRFKVGVIPVVLFSGSAGLALTFLRPLFA